MARGITVLLALCLVSAVAYFTASKWAIRHQTLTFYDASRQRPVEVAVAVRRDKEMQADAGLAELPVVVLNHGNTVKFTEYSFLANLFAVRGYLAVSIQHDLPTDGPLVTKVGEPYVGRLPVYEKGVANIDFAIAQLKTIVPNADYRRLTMVGHSNGGDISMYYAQLNPELIRRVVTLDNLRVPFMIDGKFKTLTFRSEDPVFKADPGVVPDPDVCDQAGITVVKTGFQHTEMSDRGPERVKNAIAASLDKFLDDGGIAIGRSPRPHGPGTVASAK
ncbi:MULTISPECIES: alpha/beta fold hydrolase [Rhodopseudomonas]|uniref:Putative alpha/beta-hydrolase n=1 Tax=Rhodopseudomonas palustris (strain DX-1) TaxID=652103 RepID=E6VCQ9_RHOPX|nr:MULTISPECIES: alpha/beta fold hydrolase [Rhodopseudomonas]NEW89914.1 alpha/beta fold hydrolase [Rhodopseudomonas sp. WA056]QDL97839.1 alpha/beta hydrolase [Rhodopseudomonas palustris]